MTDSADFRRVKEAESLAKTFGFKLEHRVGGILIIANKGLPAAVFGDGQGIITPHSVEEVRAWLQCWSQLSEKIEYVGFDVDEYNKRLEDTKILNTLKGKKVK
jgi:hypothetical protein